MPRYRWFAIVTGCAFVYYFIPGFLAQCLSIFAFATWLAPQNPVVNQLFGGQTGLSILPITFDWTQIAGYVGSPLIPPWYVSTAQRWICRCGRRKGLRCDRHAIANTLIGVVFFFCFLSGVLHFNGAWYGQFLPMSDSNTYDNRGNPYDTSRILTDDFTLNEEEYQKYSPLFIRYVRLMRCFACANRQYDLCHVIWAVLRRYFVSDRVYVPAQPQANLEAVPQQHH